MIPSDVLIGKERERCEKVVREEWAKAVIQYKLTPGSPTEAVVAQILNRIRRTE